MHALIIEDHALIAGMIEAELRGLGYTSFDVVDCEEAAVAAAARQCPDLVTADDVLRRGSGLAAVSRICTGRNIPVLFIVGNANAVSRVLPGAEIVEKPFLLKALIQGVKQAQPLKPNLMIG